MKTFRIEQGFSAVYTWFYEIEAENEEEAEELFRAGDFEPHDTDFFIGDDEVYFAVSKIENSESGD